MPAAPVSSPHACATQLTPFLSGKARGSVAGTSQSLGCTHRASTCLTQSRGGPVAQCRKRLYCLKILSVEGKRELQLQMTVTPFCTRNNTSEYSFFPRTITEYKQLANSQVLQPSLTLSTLCTLCGHALYFFFCTYAFVVCLFLTSSSFVPACQNPSVGFQY